MVIPKANLTGNCTLCNSNGNSSEEISLIVGIKVISPAHGPLMIFTCSTLSCWANGERVSTCLSNNFERSEGLLHEFLRGSSGANVIRLDKYLVSNDEVWRRSLAFVGRSRVSSLSCGDSLLELEMEFVEINDKISGLE